jgi:tripartite-type tricarboxylate transporter receptor subunit TctC
MRKIWPACALLVFPVLAMGQGYPSKLIRLVVAYPPGGTGDITARTIGQKLGEQLGQPVIVDNRPGAGGNIGTDFVAKAPPDGYTLVAGSSNTHVTNLSLYKSVPYDPVRDFTPITIAVIVSNVLVVNPAVPAKSVAELIALARRAPGTLKFASAGIGTTPHVAGEMFRLMTNTDLVHVPYKGGAPALVDVVAGQVELMFAGLATALPHIKAGALRALAITEKTRSRLLPELPTVAESGPGLGDFDVGLWIGFMAPANTPQDIVSRLHLEIVRALRNPQVGERLSQQGLEPLGNTPAEFVAILRADLAKWGRIFKEAGIQPQ